MIKHNSATTHHCVASSYISLTRSGSCDHLGQGLRALAREEYCPRLKQQRGKAGVNQKQRPARALQGWKMRGNTCPKWEWEKASFKKPLP